MHIIDVYQMLNVQVVAILCVFLRCNLKLSFKFKGFIPKPDLYCEKFNETLNDALNMYLF